MAELQYQNPNVANVTAQLESELTGVASDGVTELRREKVSVADVVTLLQQILDEVRAMKLDFLQALR